MLWVLLSAALAATTAGEPSSAADIVTLRDGVVLRGQVLEPSARGKLTLAVRREWAVAHVPERAKRWERAQATWEKRARAERRQRLTAWSRERVRAGDEGTSDAIASWLKAEITRLGAEPESAPPLLVVELDRTQVRKLQRAPKDAARMLRQAWRGRIADPEEKPLDEVKSLLEGLGFAMSDVDAAPIDDLLPLPFETEPRWLARRAATEVVHEPALRYIQYMDLVLPEGANGGGGEFAGAASAALKSLLGENPGNPLLPKLSEAARRGRVGVVVTRLAMAEDFSSVTIESTLWVRVGGERWVPGYSRPATVRPDALRADEGRPLEADPQVQAVFKVVEGLGLGGLSPELKQQSLNMGAATRQALGTAQAALNHDLDQLVLPVTNVVAADPPEPSAAGPP